MPKLKVNDKEVEFTQGMTVLQACELAGEEIPRFCYHERLKIAGNCRMCLVQIEGGPPKPAASCALPAAEGMKVRTDSAMVKTAREGVMEFLLINHPLDCPICDQGGECDLQDQAMFYGRGLSNYAEHKRAVKDKYMGPLIKTHMNRCIHCTRCIRFLDDVAGIHELGALGRGEHMEVTTYVEKSLSSELSGNIIDLCPVGALTSKPYAFKARPWELNKVESIDVLDATGANIRIDYRGKEVIRILPALNEDINEEWIDDKTRFSYDGLKYNRLDRPYIKKDGKLTECSFNEAYDYIITKLKQCEPESIAAIAGDLADCESMFLLKELFDRLGAKNIDCRQDNVNLNNDERGSYLFNTTIAGIEKSDACLIIGSNLRIESPIINARIRKTYLQNKMPIAYIGQKTDLTYDADYLGDSTEILKHIADGDHEFCKILENAKNPMIILGYDALIRNDGAALAYLVKHIIDKYKIVKDDFNGFNIIHRAASRVGGLDLGFLPQDKSKNVTEFLREAEKGRIKAVYLLGADELDFSKLENSFVIYQGHHGDRGAHAADVILPGAAYTEKNATYVNVEGRVQQTNRAVYPVGEAKEDWLIIAELAARAGINLEAHNLFEVRKLMGLKFPHLVNYDVILPAKLKKFGVKGAISSEPLINNIESFYSTNPISRSSKIMAKCKLIRENSVNDKQEVA